MSELLKSYDFEKFKRDVSIDLHHCFQYLKKQLLNEHEIALTLHITNRCLRNWFDLSKLGVPNIEMANAFLAEYHAVRIKKDSKRVEDRLRKLTSEVNRQFVGKRGTTFVNFGKKVNKICIREGELTNLVRVTESELGTLNNAYAALAEENDNLRQLSEQLYDNLLQAEIRSEQAEENGEEMYADMQKLKRENSYLCEYLDKIEEQESFESNGKKISDVKERQQRRKLQELKTKVDRALWFAKSFGLQLSTVEFKDDAGKPYTLEYQLTAEKRAKSYQDLSDDEKNKIRQILYITDKFCIGESVYRELTMVPGGEKLPRSYLVIQCKNNLNQLCHVSRTPGKAEGAQLDFKQELINKIKQKVRHIIKLLLLLLQFNKYLFFSFSLT